MHPELRGRVRFVVCNVFSQRSCAHFKMTTVLLALRLWVTKEDKPAVEVPYNTGEQVLPAFLFMDKLPKPTQMKSLRIKGPHKTWATRLSG